MTRITDMLFRLNAIGTHVVLWTVSGNVPSLSIGIWRGRSLVRYTPPLLALTLFLNVWPYTDRKGKPVDVEKLLEYLILLGQ